MAWNPSPEVAVARDAANKLGDASMCIVLWVTPDEKVGMASYGKTRALCDAARIIADEVWNAVVEDEQ